MASSLHVCVLYNAPVLPTEDPEYSSEAGVLESVAGLRDVLRAAGHRFTELAAGSSAGILIGQLEALHPDVVVNLCESFAGNSGGEAHVAAIMEMLSLPYTGSPPECLALSRDKAQTKRLLAGVGTATAAFIEVGPGQAAPEKLLQDWLKHGALVVKPAREDASLGIGPGSVVTDWPALRQQVEAIQQRYSTVLVERYIAGREFNVGIIELPDFQVLPLAEIEFRTSPELPWPIVTYAGKWHAGSAVDRATPVRCPAEVEIDLERQLIAAATEAYRLTGCRDYARVDLRLDQRGNVFVLEVNANPDLGPQAGLAKMLSAAGIDYSQFACRLVEAAFKRRTEKCAKQDAKRAASKAITSAAVRKLRCGDCERLIEMTRACGVFRPDEIAVAQELIGEAEREGAAGHYQILVAEHESRPVGWSCHGRVPMTDATFDLYWIVAAPNLQGSGIGAHLLGEVERNIRSAGGRWILAETSSTDAYKSARRFYDRNGFQMLGVIPDFYCPADAKVTFGKRIDQSSSS